MLKLIQLLRVRHVDSGLEFDISPDGQRVIFAWNKTGRGELRQMSLRAGRSPFNRPRNKIDERNSWETWEEKPGCKQIVDNAVTEAERILRERQVPTLDPRQEKELDKIMVAAEKEMLKKN